MDTKNKRIIFVIGSMRRGGAERVISILANEYAVNGWNVQIVTLLDDSIEYLLRQSITVTSFSNSKKSRLHQIPDWLAKLRKTFIEFEPDVIVSFIARINILTILASLGLKMKIIISERNDPKSDGRSWIIKLLTYVLYPFANLVVFQTEWARSCFPKLIQRKSVIIPNPVKVETVAKNKKLDKVVSVGRLNEQKNHKLLISAFFDLQKEYPNYLLFIYGEGNLRNELKALIESLNLSEKVFLPGNFLNIHEKIADASMFVLSSNYEGLSNALLEAMTMGLPCISTDCAGSNEIISNEENGLIVPINDVFSLSESMKKLIVNKELADKIGKKAKEDLKFFDSVIILNEWKKIIGL